MLLTPWDEPIAILIADHGKVYEDGLNSRWWCGLRRSHSLNEWPLPRGRPGMNGTPPSIVLHGAMIWPAPLDE